MFQAEPSRHIGTTFEVVLVKRVDHSGTKAYIMKILMWYIVKYFIASVHMVKLLNAMRKN